jgi:hypothetical protein
MTAISIPNTFTPLTTISSSQMNANFTAVAAAFGQSLGIAAAETLTGALRAADGAAAVPGYTFGSDTNTGMYKKASDSLGFATGGVERGYIDSSGKVFLLGSVDVATTIELGHASDTTISRASAGRVAVEGVNLALSSDVGGGRRAIADITGGDTIIATDIRKLVNIATGTGTLAFTAAATLGSTFACIIKNSGTGDVTLNPNGAELIDGLATWILYPGGTIQVYCDGTGFYSVLLSPMVKTFNSSGTFTTPGVGTLVEIDVWGAGGSGGRGTTNLAGGGGGGGCCVPFRLLRSVLSATETVTIGAGGAARTTNTNGADGGFSEFGSFSATLGDGLFAEGGERGFVAATGQGGYGGGSLGGPVPENDDDSTTYTGGDNPGFGGAEGNKNGGEGGYGHYGGGGGGGGDAASGGGGGWSVWGGGGGGGGGDSVAGGAGGESTLGGNGGAGATAAANATAGTQPAGGGGGSETGDSGAGADGRITVRIS